MARKSKKSVPAADATKSYDEFPVDDGEVVDDETVADAPEANAHGKSRDWRDVERLQEERRLRRLIADELDFDIDERPRRR